MTTEDVDAMRSLTTARVRRNYWLCDEQLRMCAEDRPRLDDAAERLQAWQSAYLTELVRRGERV